MRTILKIIAAPFVLALMLIVAVLSFLACIAGACCGLACTVFVLLAACAFFAGLHTGCIAPLDTLSRSGRRRIIPPPVFICGKEVSIRPQRA